MASDSLVFPISILAANVLGKRWFLSVSIRKNNMFSSKKVSNGLVIIARSSFLLIASSFLEEVCILNASKD